MIVIIDNYDSFVYNLYHAIALVRDTAQIKVIRNDKITISEIQSLNPKGIILSPGPGHPKDAGIGVELIRVLAPTLPILGVCLGHQAIALAFGGQVVGAKTIVHGKTAMVFHDGSRLYHDLPTPFQVGRYHSLVIEPESLPACLRVDAHIADGTIMGVRHQQFPTYGVQYHPESVLSPQGHQVVKNFIKICDEFIPLS